jgi:hypothetical protein
MENRSRSQVTGPLAAHVDGLYGALAALGYQESTQGGHARVLADLDRWLMSEGIEARQLGLAEVNGFLAHRRAAGARTWISTRGLSPVLDYLRLVVAIPTVVASFGTRSMRCFPPITGT